MVFRQVSFPKRRRFIVALQSLFRATFKHRGVEVFWVDFQHIHQKFPCPIDGIFFEIIAKRPVSEHFKHRVVVGVVSHFLQIVVLTAHAQTLLAIGGTFPLCRLIAQNNILELVHAGIGKHQCRIVFHNHWSRRHDVVPLALKKGFKRFSNFFCCLHIE